MPITSKRILIFNVNWLGDVLFSTATIRNIRRNFPESFIACVIPSRCYPILKGNPYLDEIIIFDDKDRHRGILEKLKFVKFLKNKRFDTVFLMHRSFRRALICRLAGIPQRIGHYTKKRGFLLTKSFKPPARDSLHRIDYYLDVIEKAGLKVEDRFTDFYVSEDDLKFVEDFLGRAGILRDEFIVGINPGGNWGPKRWPRSYWAILADQLIAKFKARVIITGNNKDLREALAIKDAMQANPIIACGVFSIKQFAAFSKRIDLFITADTGPLHIANSVGAKKIIAIFGPTSVAITGPYPLKNVIILQKDVGCKIPCYIVKCKDNRCMKAVTPEEVLEEVRKFRQGR
jgi:lipopolysaccharide heptosyltransferase II